VAGTTRRINTIDYVLNQFLKSGNLSKLPAVVRDALRVGAYQLLFLDGIEPSCAVDASVEIVKKGKYKGFSGMVNGVLRKIARAEKCSILDFSGLSQIAMLSLKHSFPEWLVAKWLQSFSADRVNLICEHFNNKHGLFAYCNKTKQNIVILLTALEAEDWNCRSTNSFSDVIDLGKNFKPEKSTAFLQGGMHIVDLPSVLVAKAVGANPGDKVIDLCAAPGGKTFCMAADMEGKGSIYACDVDNGRLDLIRDNMVRLGYSDQFLHLIKNDATEKPREDWIGYFDRVLVDAPCSGTGVMGRKADARWRKSSHDIAVLASIQIKILSQAAMLVKPGGTLVYSTCSMEQEEGEDVVNQFLAQNSKFSVEHFCADDGVFATYFNEDGFLRTFPHIHDLDGFFIARMRCAGE